MTKLEYDAVNDLIMKQEEMLLFKHFNNQEAWELGKLMVDEIHRQGIELTVCIRKLNENILFQYASEKTNLNNQRWMKRKFNTVSLMERSSLGVTVDSKINKQDVTAHGLSEKDYAFCGGGFPVIIKEAGIVAVITVSNQPHVQDHEFIIKCLSKYLNVTGVPEINMDI